MWWKRPKTRGEWITCPTNKAFGEYYWWQSFAEKPRGHPSSRDTEKRLGSSDICSRVKFPPTNESLQTHRIYQSRWILRSERNKVLKKWRLVQWADDDGFPPDSVQPPLHRSWLMPGITEESSTPRSSFSTDSKQPRIASLNYLPSVSFLKDRQKDADESDLTRDSIYNNVSYGASLENTIHT